MNQTNVNLNLPTGCRELSTSTCAAPGQIHGMRTQRNENAMTKKLNMIRTGSKRAKGNCCNAW